jgi:hypothetical protein
MSWTREENDIVAWEEGLLWKGHRRSFAVDVDLDLDLDPE